ncbi:hypothetical protein EJ063_12525 [Vibrio aquaticus]|uniref:Uncharacterized protein n=1 Tax=Vibrio aquaticus TaxID=2496559 RepID=A0A432CY25_9VIBR|nr:hypothetical protein [Vibrio aquaticus]RTZ15279.1 hypothetical protein EJ063_12525 [Vibrio aquaticus]
MKKSLIALVVAGSFVLAGCSSSGGSGTSDRDVDPEWGVDTTPDWGQPPVQPPVDDTPDWGGVTPPPVQPPVDNTPDRPQPDFGETPDWGVDTTPDWGVVPPPVQPPVDDNTPDRPQPDFGDTPDWGGVIGDIQIDGDGVIRFEGNQYQLIGYDEMDREYIIRDAEGELAYARITDDGRIAVIYKQQVFFFNSTRFAFTPDYDFDVDTGLDYVAKDDITSILNLQKEAIKQLNQDELIGEYLKYASGIHYDKEKMEKAAYDVAAHYLLSDDELDTQHKLGVLAFSFNGNVSIAHSIVVDALKHIENTATDSEKEQVLRHINDHLGSEHESIQQVYQAVYKHGQDMLDRLGVSGNEGNRYAIALVRNVQLHGWDHVKKKLEELRPSTPLPTQMSTPQRNIDQNRVRGDIRSRVSK